jgi:hypothetical protein
MDVSLSNVNLRSSSMTLCLLRIKCSQDIKQERNPFRCSDNRCQTKQSATKSMAPSGQCESMLILSASDGRLHLHHTASNSRRIILIICIKNK